MPGEIGESSVGFWKKLLDENFKNKNGEDLNEWLVDEISELEELGFNGLRNSWRRIIE